MYARFSAAVSVSAISVRSLDFSWIDQGHEMRRKLTEELDDAAPLFALNREFINETSRNNSPSCVKGLAGAV
jgi:hypothetical protein